MMDKKSRFSTVAWTKEVFRRRKNHEKILKNMESASFHNTSDRPSEEADPINIIVMDGGGMYGYAQIVMIEEIQKVVGQEDFLKFFDLAGGTSVGGVGALIMGQEGNNERFVKEATALLDLIREGSFKKMGLGNLFSDGTLMGEEDKMSNIYKERCQGKALYNPNGLKAFALCTVRNNFNDNNDASSDSEFKPFVLRSYDVFDDSLEQTEDANKNKDVEAFKIGGTNEIELWEAMAATSAVPVLVDRVELNANGERKKCADGGLVSNGPVAVAISEARRLWPERPIGIVLSTGCGDMEMPYVSRAIDIAKKTHSPNLHFLRLTVPMEKFSSAETDEGRVEEMKQAARDFTQEHVEEINILVEELKKSGSRCRSAPRNRNHNKSNRLHRYTLWASGRSLLDQLSDEVRNSIGRNSLQRNSSGSEVSTLKEVMKHIQDIDFEMSNPLDTSSDVYRRRSSDFQVDGGCVGKGFFSCGFAGGAFTSLHRLFLPSAHHNIDWNKD